VVRQPSRRQLWKLVHAADVVHVAGAALPPIFLGLLARKPVVVEHHGFQTICPNGQLLIEPAGVPCPGHFMAGNHAQCLQCNSAAGWVASFRLWLLTFLRRLLCARAAANITPTAWQGSLLQLPNSQCVPHGLPPGASEPRHISASSGVPEIAFLGRLVTTKGVRLLLEAASILRGQNRSFHLLIIGDGPERASLEQFVRDSQLESRVQFLGRLAGELLEATLSRVTTVVVPSIGGEVFGLVVTENMARGLPVVASDLGAFNEVLADTGVAFRTGDAADLAAALAGVLNDPSFAADLGQRARQRVKTVYGLDGMIAAHASLYARLRPSKNP
jgi:glycosyltransferase involved in cell wall biosynthesis